MSITKGWPIAGAAVYCMLVRWVARVLGGRDAVRVGEGEDEALCMVLGVVRGAVPWKNAVSTKEMAIAGSDDGEGGSFVVAALVEVRCCESISALLLVLVFFFFSFFCYVFLVLFWRQDIHSCLVDQLKSAKRDPLFQLVPMLGIINELIFQSNKIKKVSGRERGRKGAGKAKERKRNRVELTLLHEERKQAQRTSEGCGSM